MDHAFDIDLATDHRLQAGFRAIRHDLREHLAAAQMDAEDWGFTGRAAPALAAPSDAPARRNGDRLKYHILDTYNIA